MIISQPPTAPDRKPGDGTLAPVGWRGADDTTWATWRPKLDRDWQTIPVAIRDAFTTTFRRKTLGAGARVQSFKFYIDDPDDLIAQLARGYGSRAGESYWVGLYQNTYGLEYNNALLRWEFGSGLSVVHEFGHHIDYTYRAVWPGVTYNDGRVTDLPAWKAMWDAALPSMPANLYAKTNIREWFAECWRVQIENDPSQFVDFAGASVTRAAQLRAMWLALLPPLPPLRGF